MATLQKRRGRPYWYARFQIQGHQYELSTGETKKSEAEKVMQRLIAEKQGETTVDDLIESLEAQLILLPAADRDVTRRTLAARLLQGQDAKLRIADAWQAWLTNPKRRNPAQRTVTAYQGRWNAFVKWLAKTDPEVTFLHEVTPSIAEAYASHLWGLGISPSTFNLHIGFLRALFSVLKTQAGLQVNVWDELPNMELSTNSRRDLTAAELATVLSKARGNLRYMFALGLYTGMRLGDVVTLRWSAVDLDGGYITHTPMKTQRKNKVVRLPIHPVLEALLRQLREERPKSDKFLFPDEARSYSQDGSLTSKAIQKHFEHCGIQTVREGTGRKTYKAALRAAEAARKQHKKVAKPTYTRAVVEVGFHSLRHSFVSLCAANSVPQVAIMELVGHGSPAMTRLYSHAGDEQKVKAIAALPAIAMDNDDDDDTDE